MIPMLNLLWRLPNVNCQVFCGQKYGVIVSEGLLIAGWARFFFCHSETLDEEM